MAFAYTDGTQVVEAVHVPVLIDPWWCRPVLARHKLVLSRSVRDVGSGRLR